MFPVKTSADQSAPTGHHQFKALRAARDHLALAMRELEEQLPLPADRRVRDASSAQQKATALRIEIEELNLRLTQIARQIKVMNRKGVTNSSHKGVDRI